VPFTFSHPAVVLPLQYINEKKFSVTALTIGSLTPDFEYFIRMVPVSIHSHKIKGIFWYDLPLSIAIFVLYTVVVKQELIDNLPSFLNRRFSRFKILKRISYTGENALVILSSLFIGISSHVLWDKLTHKTAFVLPEGIEFYSFVWNASSVIGALVIAFIVLRLPKSPAGNKEQSFLFWFLILCSVLVLVIYRSAENVSLQYLTIAAISGLFIGLICASLVHKIIRRYRFGGSLAHRDMDTKR
jgi:hypothetical protein